MGQFFWMTEKIKEYFMLLKLTAFRRNLIAFFYAKTICKTVITTAILA